MNKDFKEIGKFNEYNQIDWNSWEDLSNRGREKFVINTYHPDNISKAPYYVIDFIAGDKFGLDRNEKCLDHLRKCQISNASKIIGDPVRSLIEELSRDLRKVTSELHSKEEDPSSDEDKGNDLNKISNNLQALRKVAATAYEYLHKVCRFNLEETEKILGKETLINVPKQMKEVYAKAENQKGDELGIKEYGRNMLAKYLQSINLGRKVPIAVKVKAGYPIIKCLNSREDIGVALVQRMEEEIDKDIAYTERAMFRHGEGTWDPGYGRE